MGHYQQGKREDSLEVLCGSQRIRHSVSTITMKERKRDGMRSKNEYVLNCTRTDNLTD